MAEQTIIITIDENGKITAETSGIKGEVCLDQLQDLLEDIAPLTSLKKTDEYYQEKHIKVNNQLKQKRH